MEGIGIGGMLRAARVRWGLSLKEVEERSQILAQHWKKPECWVSESWLDRVERQNRELAGTKLLVLAAIYGLTMDEMLASFSAPAGTPSLLERKGPNKTLLFPRGPLDEEAKRWLPEHLVTDPPPEHTMLVTTASGTLPVHYRRGVIGRSDRTLDPMVRAGSIVLIDTTLCSIESRKRSQTEFERPIYFLITRTGYASGFCELDQYEEWLTLVPHALSVEQNKRFRYKKEIEVLGTVTAVFSRRVA